MKQKPRFLTAQEAAQELQISVSTLYAYVSRGRVRSEPAGGSKRTRLYHAEDIEKLKARKAYRQNPDVVAEQALSAGEPVLDSAITLISETGIYYRGYDALRLATDYSVEEVAALIWTEDLAGQVSTLARTNSGHLSERSLKALEGLGQLRPIDAYQVILPLAALDDLAAYDLRPAAVSQTGSRILRLMTAITIGDTLPEAGIAEILQRAWLPDQPKAKALLSATLILCADHELNASAFTARCVASTGSNPYNVVVAGLAALQGFKHGTASDQVEAFLQEVEAQTSVRQAIVARLKRGESIPGFGHVIYRDVDPRGRLLRQLLVTAYPDSPVMALIDEIIKETDVLTDHRYNIDFMLAALARVLSLPPGGATALFALGRTIGWIGHAIEQYALPRIIRPRARYVGKRPDL